MYRKIQDFLKTWKDRELSKSHQNIILIAIIVIPDHANVTAVQNIRFG